MTGSQKAERKEVEKEGEAQKKSLVDKAQSTIDEIKCVGNERSRGERKRPRTKPFLGRSARWLFLLLILMQNWLRVDAAAGRLKPKREAEVPEIIIMSDGRHFRGLGWQKPW